MLTWSEGLEERVVAAIDLRSSRGSTSRLRWCVGCDGPRVFPVVVDWAGYGEGGACGTCHSNRILVVDPEAREMDTETTREGFVGATVVCLDLVRRKVFPAGVREVRELFLALHGDGYRPCTSCRRWAEPVPESGGLCSECEVSELATELRRAARLDLTAAIRSARVVYDRARQGRDDRKKVARLFAGV